MKQVTDYINESSLSRLWSKAKNHDTGTITAFRSAADCGTGDKYTKQENKKRNNRLYAQLMKAGYSITKVDGVYIENYKSDNEIPVKENAFFVVDHQDKGTLKKDLIRFGEMFEQDSITFSNKDGSYFLISTNKCPEAYPGFGKIGVEEKLGKPMFGKGGVFHSKINGRNFVFENAPDDFISITDLFPTEIRSIHALCEEK